MTGIELYRKYRDMPGGERKVEQLKLWLKAQEDPKAVTGEQLLDAAKEMAADPNKRPCDLAERTVAVLAALLHGEPVELVKGRAPRSWDERIDGPWNQMTAPPRSAMSAMAQANVPSTKGATHTSTVPSDVTGSATPQPGISQTPVMTREPDLGPKAFKPLAAKK